MFSVYIKNYADPASLNPESVTGANLITTETKLYDIPSDYASDLILPELKINTEMGKAGSMEFKMQPSHPYYNCLRQMKTIMRVTYEDITLFRGRVLTIDNTLYGERSVHLEGDLTFLLDSYQEAMRDEKQQKKSLETYLTEVISNHNSAVEADKQFTKGQVPGQYSAAIPNDMRIIIDSSIDDSTKKYNTNSWVQTMNALESLTSQYGGYLRTRYESGTTYIDWFRNYFDARENPQVMEVGSNLLDLSNTLEVNNLFTVIIPIGTRKGKALYLTDLLGHKYMTVPEITEWYTTEELSTAFHTPSEYANALDNYGWIYKTVQFSNADTTDTLFKYAKDWVKNNYHGGISSFTISALDLHMAGENIRPYLTGDLVRVRYPSPTGNNSIEGVYVLLKASYDLYNPENNQYTVGIPDMALNKTYGEAKTSSGGGGRKKSPTDSSSDGEGNTGSLIDGLIDENESLKNSFMWKTWQYSKTGDWSEDDGESTTDNTDPTNDEMDEEEKFDFFALLRGDGGKFNLFDSVAGNFNSILTVGGTNTINSLMHMADGAPSGTWKGSSPIILDGATGDVISKRGHAVFQSIDVGSLDAAGTDNNLFYVTSAGKVRGQTFDSAGDITANTRVYFPDNHQGDIITSDGSGDINIFAGDIKTASGKISGPEGIFSRSVSSAAYYVSKSDGEGGTVNGDNLASKAFVDAAVSESDGVITFNFWGPNKTQSDTPTKSVNFNMADTQFFKDEVAAAEERGKNVTISAVAETTAYDPPPGGSYQLFTNVTFQNGKWYRIKVSAGNSTKNYVIKIQV